LNNGRKSDVLLNPRQFYVALVGNLKRRMFTTSAGHSVDDYTDLITNVKKLKPENWPDDASIVFADDSIRALCKKFVNTNTCQHGFREWQMVAKLFQMSSVLC
jgi:hypothetical protein